MSNARGLLCIWTGIAPEHEADFNRWYDREHMQERVAIPGFQAARRFHAVEPSERPYLALYATDSLAVFTSPAYRQAFTQQTEWSLRNFARMQHTQRRVGTLVLERGEGEGGALAVLVLPPALVDAAALQPRLDALLAQDHIVAASLLHTDAALSTPLTAGAVPAAADGLVFVEATRPEAARAAAQGLALALGQPAAGVAVFQSLWRLGA